MKTQKRFSTAGNSSDPTARLESMLHLCPPLHLTLPRLLPYLGSTWQSLSEQFTVSELKGSADGLASYQSQQS